MQQVTRFIFAFSLIISLIGPALTKASAKDIEYKRTDTNFYWKGDVLKAEPAAVIIPAGNYIQKGDTYTILGRQKASKEVYIQVVNDWVEPITPPDMPASLGVAPDAMQIREPQGDVQVALPSAPADFTKATEGMTIPNGAVIKTGADGTAAVLFGGVNSARLIPNSQAAVQQTVTPQLRSTEVDLTAGAVFSKVGLRPGEKQDYQVHTPFGVAAAKGTDFVSVALPARTDVWIAQGIVQLNQPDGKVVGTVSSEGAGPLKIIRYPVMTDVHQAMMASAETMTAAMNVIPMINMKVKALHDQMAKGMTMSPRQKEYLSRIKKVPCLIKLALVEPPAPPTPPPLAPKPKLTPAPPVKVKAKAPAPAPEVKPAVPVDSTSTAPIPSIKATVTMTPRTDDTMSAPSASTAPPKKKKIKSTASSDEGTSAPAPISTGPNDTTP